MDRGEVHLLSLLPPNRETGQGTVRRDKYVITLRGGQQATTEAEVPVVVASTDRRGPDRALRSFEVSVGPQEGFVHATLIDCRWVHTLPKSDLTPDTYRFSLSVAVMHRVSVALVAAPNEVTAAHAKVGVSHAIRRMEE